ncbi:MAG: malonate decarboxylase holo-[acyl-carrier-protein] synthase [Pseudomonadota bacterium]|nr:malonate decarboxylase holo-[acyl-carrier-protein] synthase [Pseudomonadota bacterium]
MFSRHELVWLTPAGWDAAIARSPHAALTLWRARNWPAVVRRHEDGAGIDDVCLGIPLPLSFGARQRLALVVKRSHVARRQLPLPLADALSSAPPEWLAALVALQRAAVVDLRVFGSLAMQSLTGMAYVRAQSDIDLLMTPTSHAELEGGLNLVSEASALLPLDGEIVFANGAAVAWKEWLAARRDGARVLVKSIDSVRLMQPAMLVLA